MKTRKEVAEYINSGKLLKDTEEKYPEKQCWHIGKCDLNALLDFIYENAPSESEIITEIYNYT